MAKSAVPRRAKNTAFNDRAGRVPEVEHAPEVALQFGYLERPDVPALLLRKAVDARQTLAPAAELLFVEVDYRRHGSVRGRTRRVATAVNGSSGQ